MSYWRMERKVVRQIRTLSVVMKALLPFVVMESKALAVLADLRSTCGHEVRIVTENNKILDVRS